jgi:AraC-like DNA-binding protein
MSPLVDPFVRGVGVGALAVTAVAVWRSNTPGRIRWPVLLLAVSLTGWMITEAEPLWAAFGHFFPLIVVAFPPAAFFWIFVRAVFEERPVTPRSLIPAAILLLSGASLFIARHPAQDIVWVVRNLFSAGLVLHAGIIIARGWRDDLMEARRRLRSIVLTIAVAYSLIEVAAAFAYRFGHMGFWPVIALGGIGGGTIFALICVAMGIMALQAAPAVFGVSRRPEAVADARAEAADRLLLGKLDALMSGGAWKTEGLSIVAVAATLETPEHRLRRLINQKLGHRNFADYLNRYRIGEAQRRLADPADARATVASIAFELGYGSLGPFNRAFRAATGSSPTEWRRRALAETSPILEEAV